VGQLDDDWLVAFDEFSARHSPAAQKNMADIESTKAAWRAQFQHRIH